MQDDSHHAKPSAPSYHEETILPEKPERTVADTSHAELETHLQPGNAWLGKFGLFKRLTDLWKDHPHGYTSRFRVWTLGTFVLFAIQSIVASCGNLSTPAAHRGIVDLELAHYQDNATLILQSWLGGPIRAALGTVLIDFFCIFAYVVLLFGMCWWAKTKAEEFAPEATFAIRWGERIAGLQIIAGICDVLENLGLIAMLAPNWSQTEQAVSPVPILPLLTFLFAVTKFSLIGAGLLYFLVSLRLNTEARSFFSVVHLIGISLFFSLAAPLVFFLTQGGEIIRVLGEGLVGSDLRNSLQYSIFFVAGSLFLAITVWYWAEALINYDKHVNQPVPDEGYVWATRNLPFLSYAFTLSICAVAVWLAAFPTMPFASRQDEGPGKWIEVAVGPSGRLGLIVISLLLAVAVILGLAFKRRAELHIQTKGIRNRLFLALSPMSFEYAEQKWLIPVITIFMEISIFLLALFNPLLISKLGTGAVFLFAIAFIVTAGSLLILARIRTRLPFLTILLILAVVVSLYDLGDDHMVRQIDTKGKQIHLPTSSIPLQQGDLEVQDLNYAFTDWLNKRVGNESLWTGEPADPYTGKQADPYPVFFIATEGGGIRAAYQTAQLLASIQQESVMSNPDPKRRQSFAQHVFMISSVSGGSLGAAVFAGLTATPQLPAQDWVDVTDTTLKTDLLSASLASLLSTDLLPRFFPWASPLPNADRAQVLELAFEQAWKDGLAETTKQKDAPNIMTESFYSIYQDFSTSPSSPPALFLNTTCVESGDRMVVSNLWPRAHSDPWFKEDPNGVFSASFSRDRDGTINLLPGIDGLHSIAGITENFNIRLSTAAILSARFPLFSPAGGLFERRIILDESGQPIPIRFTRRYVDGGYYENSGISTLNDVLMALNAYEMDPLQGQDRRKSWYPVILVISFADGKQSKSDQSKKANPNSQFPQEARRSPFDELSPLLAFLHTSQAHGNAAHQHIGSNLELLQHSRGKNADVIEFTFRQYEGTSPLPLGWLLSRGSRVELSRQIGAPYPTLLKDEIEKAIMAHPLPPPDPTGKDPTIAQGRIKVMNILAKQPYK